MSESVFLSPKSIAVIGASDKQGSVGRAITSNIMNGYKGIVYPISPTRETVFDQKAYKSVLDVPDSIDLAVVITKNTIVRWGFQYYFLTVDYEPYLASIIGQIIAVSIYMVIINFLVKITKWYKND